jgi:hypothetical protein
MCAVCRREETDNPRCVVRDSRTIRRECLQVETRNARLLQPQLPSTASSKPMHLRHLAYRHDSSSSSAHLRHRCNSRVSLQFTSSRCKSLGNVLFVSHRHAASSLFTQVKKVPRPFYTVAKLQSILLSCYAIPKTPYPPPMHIQSRYSMLLL